MKEVVYGTDLEILADIARHVASPEYRAELADLGVVAAFNPAPPAVAVLPGNAAALPAGSNLARSGQALVPAVQPGTVRQPSTPAGQHALPQIPLRRAFSAPARRPEVENPFRVVPIQNPPSIGQGLTAPSRAEAQSSVAPLQQRATSEQQLSSLPPVDLPLDLRKPDPRDPRTRNPSLRHSLPDAHLPQLPCTPGSLASASSTPSFPPVISGHPRELPSPPFQISDGKRHSIEEYQRTQSVIDAAHTVKPKKTHLTRLRAPPRRNPQIPENLEVSAPFRIREIPIAEATTSDSSLVSAGLEALDLAHTRDRSPSATRHRPCRRARSVGPIPYSKPASRSISLPSVSDRVARNRELVRTAHRASVDEDTLRKLRARSSSSIERVRDRLAHEAKLARAKKTKPSGNPFLTPSLRARLRATRGQNSRSRTREPDTTTRNSGTGTARTAPNPRTKPSHPAITTVTRSSSTPARVSPTPPVEPANPSYLKVSQLDLSIQTNASFIDQKIQTDPSFSEYLHTQKEAEEFERLWNEGVPE
ncbi:hypothetical protein QAD02_007306 [Eretmocerus hayati]|uniref:Uncharacterized protein n=1 Tax=Eretmocerus hayati TaxID=131215 RepID=A0ACC2N5N8_9HYME|nr:hypothetical protein QAD02_007306 [Eretmocerus hayati]